MRQRTLGLIGAVLVLAGIALSVGSDVAARRLAPRPMLSAPGAVMPLPPGDGRHPNPGR